MAEEKKQLTPGEVIAAVSSELQTRMTPSSVSPEADGIFTPALATYITQGVSRIFGEAVTIAVDERAKQRPDQPGERKEQTNVTWDIELKGIDPLPPFRMRPQYDPTEHEEFQVPWRPYQGKLYAPDYEDFVEDMADRYPDLIRDDPDAFTQMVAEELHAIDPNFGRKSRVGGGLSNDTLGYKRPDGYIEPIDIIMKAGTPNAGPAWMNWGPRYDAEWHAP